MESSKRGLQATRRQVEQNIVSLEEEYLLAEDNLGMVQYAVQTYLDGFNRGYQTYLQEQILNDKFSI
jgi:ribosome recycling factor